MAIFTKCITFIVVLVFINKLHVFASMKERLNSAKMRLDYLEVRVDNDSMQTKSEFSSLEESVLNLNASVTELIDTICSTSEENDKTLASGHKIAQQSEEELSALERGQIAVSSGFGRPKRCLRQKLGTSEMLFDKLNQTLKKSMDNYESELSDQKKDIGEISSQTVNLQTKLFKENLEKTVQNYNKYLTELFIPTKESIKTEIKRESLRMKGEVFDELLFWNISVRKELFQQTLCLNGWLLFDKHCYYYDEKVEKTFSSARDYCRTLNAYIADVESSSESKFIYSLIGYIDVEMWAGISDEKEENVWISERTNQTVAYTNWRPLDPDGGRDQNCVMLGYKYTNTWHYWIDSECHKEHRFVCKKEANLPKA